MPTEIIIIDPIPDVVIVDDVDPSVIDLEVNPVHVHPDQVVTETSFMAVAGETLLSGDLVCIKAGKAMKLKTDTGNDYGLKVGFALNGANLDQPLRVRFAGIVHKPGWGLVADVCYWATNNGLITNTVTTEKLILTVGAAIDTDKLMIHFGTSYVRQ